ncbi:helix-turn-helix domain-containing protein [Kitasatospora sp. NPDC058218]|uniref:helix-turn-helix domain-containing protein n=1 Tax=Kitasatospora sp. NPDC058218 TaxID=3346385 RepID=UPI0036DBA43B
MQIHRIPKHGPGYTILDNGHVIRKHKLSWAARGLLSYLLSLPDGAREDVRTLAAKSVEGRTTVARALRELEEAGHYVRRTSRDPVTGQVRTTVSVHEVPLTAKAAHTLPPLPVSPAAGRPGVGAAGAGKAGSPSLRVRSVMGKEVEGPSVHPPGATAEQARASGPVRMTEGMALLLELGRRDPRMALAGKPLTDQAARVEGLLTGGWTWEALTGVLAAPLPEKITRSVGAILAGRLSNVPPFPPAQRPAEAAAPAPTPRVTYDCDVCRAPGKTRPGVCRMCRTAEGESVEAVSEESQR